MLLSLTSLVYTKEGMSVLVPPPYRVKFAQEKNEDVGHATLGMHGVAKAYTIPRASVPWFFNTGQSLLYDIDSHIHSKCSSLVVIISGMPTILCQVTNSLAVGALGCTLSIMVIVALRAQRFRSSIRFLLSRPYRISLNHILFLEKLLLILAVVIEFSLVLSLSFHISAEFLIHQVVVQLDSKIKSLGSCRHDISMNVIGKSTDVLVNLLGFIKKEFSAHQGQFLETLSV
nr:hypothetical protein [Tanacetum cinerariifolium]